MKGINIPPFLDFIEFRMFFTLPPPILPTPTVLQFSPPLCALSPALPRPICSVQTFPDVWPSPGGLTSAYTFSESSLLSPQYCRLANSCSAWGGGLCPTPFSMPRISQAWACTGLAYAVITTVPPYVHWSCCVHRHSLLLVIHCFWRLDSSCPLWHSDP